MEQRLRGAIEASKDAIETNTGVRPDFILTDDPSFAYLRAVARRRPHYRGGLAAEEARALAARILPDLERYASAYDVRKYPPEAYREVRGHFESPWTLTGVEIRKALVWKYGHVGKARIPQHHEALILEIADRWPDVLERLPLTPKDVFFHLTEMIGGPKRFITVACLTHLMFPNWVPIIDQHNFRAMNWLMSLVRPEWRSLKAPTMWEDIMWLNQFMTEVPNAWPPGHEAPSRLVFDRYLMMFGKAVKGGNGNRVC